MRTVSKLDRAFMEAFPVPFDDRSKLVFFSDIHRGDDSLSDDFGRNRHIYYHALNYYYQNDFTYVEAGDGDELWENPQFQRIYNSHPSIFDLLKKFHAAHRMHILYGNHNMQLRNENYVKANLETVYDDYTEDTADLFPGIHVHEAIVLKHRDTGQEIFVVHGHQGDLFNDQFWRFSCIVVRFLWRYLHLVGFRYAASPARSREKRHRLEKHYQKWCSRHGISLICGHTHRPKFPSPGEPAYFNCGCCIHPRGIHCIEIVYGKIYHITWHMHSKRDGSLYIKRTLLKGPEPIINFCSETSYYHFDEEE
ncbi:MAG: serine/threonine protein phosphatase [Clostridiales Family XIII bacterium]|jgi:UDP-2,3-diacylglucosamine pyrophosphatase LpxH|nr:serine/threonine protein phosphatase [Clostridiales Family XIII bacterium]